MASGIRGSAGMKAGVSAHGQVENDLPWGTATRLSGEGGLDLGLEPSAHITRSSNGTSGPRDSSGAAAPSVLRLAEMRAANAGAAKGTSG